MPQSNKHQDPPAREIATARKTMTEQERGLATTAFSLFKSRNFDGSLQQLKALLELRQHDARVIFNKAVVEYYISKLCKTDDFQKQLSAAKKQLEFGMINTGDELDDIDRSFLLYDEAVILFHLKQYKGAINILERLFKIIEPLGDLLAAKVCILLIEVYLQNYQLEPAHGMILYIENKLTNSEHSNEEEHAALAVTFQPKLQMLKVRLLMARGFYSQSKKELDLATSNNNKSVEAVFLKANVEWVCSNHDAAIRLLNNAPKNSSHLETGQPLLPMFYNNMACVHFSMKKYNLAVLYAKKAFNENQIIMKNLPLIEKNNSQSGRPLQTLAINKRIELLYNLGVSLLFADQPIPAFDCLMEAQSRYQCNPRFWLRLAECCIAVAQQPYNNLESNAGKKNEYVKFIIGSGPHRKIVLSPFRHHLPQPRQPGQSAAMPGPTLEFANLCLSNAILLMPTENKLETAITTLLRNDCAVPEDDDKEPVKRSSLGRIFVDVPPGDPIQTKEAYYLRGSILCCRVFVSLSIADYHKALEYTNELLRMKHIISYQRFLAHMYRTEALIKLDRINEAIQELSPDILKSFSMLEQDVQNIKAASPFPKNLNEARAFMIVNVGNISCLRGEFAKCKHLLRQVISTETPACIRSHAVLLSIYCDLQMGQIQSALNLIKRNEIFPSGRLVDRVDAARAMQQLTPQVFLQQSQQGLQAPIGIPSPAVSSSSFSTGNITYSPPGIQNPPPSAQQNVTGNAFSLPTSLNGAINQTQLISVGTVNSFSFPIPQS